MWPVQVNRNAQAAPASPAARRALWHWGGLHSPPMDRLSSVQALRGLAVGGVVLYHAQFVERKYASGDLLLPAFFDIGQTGVDLFFVISGFVMVFVTQGRFGDAAEAPRFLWGRLSRIYPNYWLYYALTLAVLAVKPQWVNASQGGDVRLLSSFFLWPTERLPLVMVAWSLIHEIWFYLVFAGLLCLRARWLLPALLIWSTVIVGASVLMTVDPQAALLRIVLHAYTLEFVIGALVALFFLSPRRVIVPRALAWAIFVSPFLVGLPLARQFDLLGTDGLARALMLGGVYGLALFGAVTLETAHRVAVPRPLKLLGDMSYTVYLSHLFVLGAVGRVWAATMPGAGIGGHAAALLLMLTAVACYGWLAFRWVESPLLDLSHRLRARWFGLQARHTSA